MFYFSAYFFGFLPNPNQTGFISDHYRPSSKLFPSKMKIKVLLSDLGILIMLGILFKAGAVFGFKEVFLWYGLACFATNHGFVALITWIQHTHPTVPHFGPDEWTWLKGALVGTIDRPDPLIDWFAHNIGSTHLCHHLFHEIPFYNAVEATACLRAYLEPKGLYNFDPTYQGKVIFLAAKHCHFVESLNGVQFYKSFESLTNDEKKKMI
mmetsp:Transcript_41789/g.71499  ORF Transcript_41789/g.71499 Transcript_41789/m.71499 type:complete len:209 (-) Transcript_41789:104-730(-)